VWQSANCTRSASRDCPTEWRKCLQKPSPARIKTPLAHFRIWHKLPVPRGPPEYPFTAVDLPLRDHCHDGGSARSFAWCCCEPAASPHQTSLRRLPFTLTMNGAQWPDGPRVAVVFGWAPAYCWLRMKRQRCQRKRWAAAIRCLPAAVFGPVLHPPWLRQRPLGYVRR